MPEWIARVPRRATPLSGVRDMGCNVCSAAEVFVGAGSDTVVPYGLHEEESRWGCREPGSELRHAGRARRTLRATGARRQDARTEPDAPRARLPRPVRPQAR